MIRRIAVVAVACAIVSCRGTGVRHDSFAVAAPLAEARIRGTHLHVRLAPGRRLSEVIAVPTEPLKPDMTITQARRIAGEPLATRTDEQGTYYLYRRQPIPVELAHLTGAGTNRGTRRYWSVASAGGPASVVFGPALQDLIARARPVRTIVIHEEGVPDRAAFAADVDGGTVSRLLWYSIVDLPE